jgi:hypothetical protein
MNFFFTYTLCFAIYGFIGWVVESTYCSILFHRPVNRGFLNGPIIPVYAVGGLTMIFFSMLLPPARTGRLDGRDISRGRRADELRRVFYRLAARDAV